MAAFIGPGFGNDQVTATGQRKRVIETSGYLTRADFVTATGAIGMLKLPIGSHIFHTGTVLSTTAIAACLHIVRVLESNDTVADYFLCSDGGTAAALTTLITG